MLLLAQQSNFNCSSKYEYCFIVITHPIILESRKQSRTQCARYADQYITSNILIYLQRGVYALREDLT